MSFRMSCVVVEVARERVKGSQARKLVTHVAYVILRSAQFLAVLSAERALSFFPHPNT